MLLNLIRKYSIVLIIGAILDFFTPMLVGYYIVSTGPIQMQNLINIMGYIINVIIAIILLADIKKSESKSWVIFVLAIILRTVGVIFFLILTAYENKGKSDFDGH